MIYDSINSKEFEDKTNSVEVNSTVIDNVVEAIISPYINDLDTYITYIRGKLKDGTRPPTTTELDTFCMKLATYIYFASGMSEKLGIRDDISKALYKETYNNHRNSIQGGTVADKNTMAELESQHEQLTNICYSRAYKIVKEKVSAAQELLGSCKKVLSHRIQEMSLTQIDKN